MPKQKESGACPLVDREITGNDCAPVVMTVDKNLPPYGPDGAIPREFRQKSGWREICKTCPHRPKQETKTE